MLPLQKVVQVTDPDDRHPDAGVCRLRAKLHNLRPLPQGRAL